MTSIEPLLFRSEGDTLDFKGTNYAFYRASDAEKSELLKDIIAMANAWKNGDAHIVIGVQEENGRAAEIVGIEPNLFDNDVQQFVNTKTNRPVIFSIEHVPYGEKNLTVIRIDGGQIRPVFLRKSFGALRNNLVYLRRGSSTVEASPDEVKEMGKAEALARAPARPDVNLELELVLEIRPSQNFFSFEEDSQEIEVCVLRVSVVNRGAALARFVQGHLSIPVPLVHSHSRASTTEITRAFSNKIASSALDYANETHGEWSPLSPGMRLHVHEEHLRRELVASELSIRWELGVDDCPLRIGQCVLRDIPLIDHRNRQ